MVRRLGIKLAVVGTAFCAVALLPALAPGAASLTITKSDSADPVVEKTDLTYTIEVANSGADAAEGVVVTDRLPAGLKFISVTSTQGSACDRSGRRIECPLGTIPSGAGATIEILVQPRRDGRITNNATVKSTSPYTEDRSDSEVTNVSNAPPPPRCRGLAANIVGSDAADNLIGTDKRDVIVARGGDDVITALDGDDVICSGSGNDTIRGNAGNDIAGGGRGNDRMRGGRGADRLNGGADNDVIGGGGGNDTLTGGRGFDRCAGGRGRDVERSCER